MLLALLVLAQAPGLPLDAPVLPTAPSGRALHPSEEPGHPPALDVTRTASPLPAGKTTLVMLGIGALAAAVGGVLLATAVRPTRCSFVCISDQHLAGFAALLAGASVAAIGLLAGGIMAIINVARDAQDP